MQGRVELCFCVCIATDIDRALQQCRYLKVLNKMHKDVIFKALFCLFPTIESSTGYLNCSSHGLQTSSELDQKQWGKCHYVKSKLNHKKLHFPQAENK